MATEPKLGIIECLILCRRHNCRVTFGAEVVIEAAVAPGDWRVIARAPTFADATKEAMEKCGWN